MKFALALVAALVLTACAGGRLRAEVMTLQLVQSPGVLASPNILADEPPAGSVQRGDGSWQISPRSSSGTATMQCSGGICTLPGIASPSIEPRLRARDLVNRDLADLAPAAPTPSPPGSLSYWIGSLDYPAAGALAAIVICLTIIVTTWLARRRSRREIDNDFALAKIKLANEQKNEEAKESHRHEHVLAKELNAFNLETERIRQGKMLEARVVSSGGDGDAG